MVKVLLTLTLSLNKDYLVIEIDGYETGWGGALFRKTSKMMQNLQKPFAYMSLANTKKKDT